MPSDRAGRKRYLERGLLWNEIMLLQLDAAQAIVLEEVLASQKKQLMVETARTDSHDFREELHHREDAIEAVLAQLIAARTGRRRAS
jgi:hypothetical protein